MAQRRSIITLDNDEREVLKAAIDGRPLENVMRRYRKIMKEGLDEARRLQESEELEREQLVTARFAMKKRLQLLRKLSMVSNAEDFADLISIASEPLVRGIELCDAIEREQYGDVTPDDVAAAPATAPAPVAAPATT